MRFPAVLAVSAVVVSLAAADIAIPPPKGKKFVPVSSTVKLEKELKGYVLFTRANAPGQTGAMPKKFELSTEKATALPEWGRRSMSVYAVPEDMVSKLTTAKEWNKALWEEKKSVILTHDFPAQEEVDEKDERKKIERAFVIQEVTEKGIKVVEVKEDKAEVKPEKKEEPKKRQAFAEPGYLIGGVALTVGVTLGGLWLVRRKK